LKDEEYTVTIEHAGATIILEFVKQSTMNSFLSRSGWILFSGALADAHSPPAPPKSKAKPKKGKSKSKKE